MKKRVTYSRFNLLGLFVIFSLLLTACGAGGSIATGGDGTIIWLDQPMTNYMLPMAPFTLIAHAGHPGAGISQVAFLVNGVSVGSVPSDTTLDFIRAETSWNPSGPGLYMIQAQATSPGGATYSHISYICVMAGITAPQPWLGSCAPTTENPFTINFNLSPNPVYRGSCPANALDFQAILSGDTSAVTGLRASWSFTNPDGSAPAAVSGENDLVMARQPDGTYTYTRDFSNADRDFGLTTGTYRLYASVWAVDATGNRLETQNIGPFDWLDCSAGPTGTAVVPSATPILPTATASILAITPIIPTRTPAIASATPVVPTATSVPADTTPPSISGITVNPSDVAYYISGCGPNSVTVQVNVTDPSGVTSVNLNYQYSGGSVHSLTMSHSGGSTYTATINVGAEGYAALSGVTGTLTLSVQAADKHKNSTSSNWGGSISIQYCPG